jgi:hypothetical protein
VLFLGLKITELRIEAFHQQYHRPSASVSLQRQEYEDCTKFAATNQPDANVKLFEQLFDKARTANYQR